VTTTPIADYGFLSDCHSAALVGTDGSVDWWCVPRFDSPAVFGRILDETAGHFRIAPTVVRRVARHYEEGSLTLATLFETADGAVRLTDALALADGVRGHDVGRDSPHLLVRAVECVAGSADVAVDIAARFGYGRETPSVEAVEGGLVLRGGGSVLTVSSPVPLAVDGARARATLRLRSGERVLFGVQHDPDAPPPPLGEERLGHLLADTTEAWRSWGAEHERYTGPYAELVARSGYVLQGLTYVPTGAIVAAATTSLPETVGGERNWDYRYSWVRDSALTLNALWVAACPDEAVHFFRYLTSAAASREAGDLPVVFGATGDGDLTERTLDWLSGWRGSRPVRVGNAAADQVQNDIYGELLDAAHRLRHRLGGLGEAERRLLVAAADRAASVWTEPDHGIWEMRDAPRHHLYSKLLCWVALDRAIALADDLGANARVGDWARTRDAVAEAILVRGWSERLGSFTQAFDGDEVDASALVVPLVGFLPAGDPRVLSTIAAVERHLVGEDGLVRRYRGPDGLAGEEGPFLLCTFWLAEAHALAGNGERAREVFETAVGHANDLGLLAEEVDPSGVGLLGNFPQAFSHIGLVNAAWAIAGASGGD